MKWSEHSFMTLKAFYFKSMLKNARTTISDKLASLATLSFVKNYWRIIWQKDVIM